MSGTAEAAGNGTVVVDHWLARKIRPVVLLYVTGVFVAFMLMAHLIFHSPEAVKALVIAWIGAIAATVPGVMEKVEYRLTDSGIDRRTLKTKSPGPFKEAFRWRELSRVVPMKHGFKYYKTMAETNPLRRFWKQHISNRYSGEVHAEKVDLGRVLGIVERKTSSVPDHQ